jgi:hypothetical protein
MKIRGWETWLAVASAAAFAWFAKPTFFASSASEIVTILGFVLAALLPAMVLSATALRSGAFSVQRLVSLHAALAQQVAVFGGVFIYGLALCAVVIVGKAAEWSVPVFGLGERQFDLSKVYGAAVAFGLTFLLLRVIAVVFGIRSVLNLVAQIAVDEARIRDAAKFTSELGEYQTPTDYGKAIDLPEH